MPDAFQAPLLKPASEPLGADLFPSILEVGPYQTSATSEEVSIPVNSIAYSFAATDFRLYLLAQALMSFIGAIQASILVDFH